MVELIPAILVHSKEELKKDLALWSPLFKTGQLDIMDGKFVNNKTFYASALKGLRTKMDFEVHLMTFNLMKHVKEFAKIKKVKRILFHYEACKDDQEVLNLINFCKINKLQVGIAINPDTTVSKVKHFIPILDAILIMGVTPGWSGQKFKPEALKKLKEIRKLSKKIKLQFDGGVNKKTITKIAKAGAQRIALRSALLGSENISQAKRELNKLIK